MPRETKAQAAERLEAIEYLRGILPPGSTVYTVLRHVSRSGMYRSIDLYVLDVDEHGHPGRRWISSYAARACGWKLDKRDAIGAGGCGMDMGFHLVSTLSRVLYPDGFGCIGKGADESRTRCPSNDHSNGDRDYTPHATAEPRPCPGCNGSGQVDWHYLGTVKAERRECRTCGGKGALDAGHWHRSGDYAISHEWL